MTRSSRQPPGVVVLDQVCTTNEEFITQTHEEDESQAQGADGWNKEMELSRILGRKAV